MGKFVPIFAQQDFFFIRHKYNKIKYLSCTDIYTLWTVGLYTSYLHNNKICNCCIAPFNAPSTSVTSDCDNVLLNAVAKPDGSSDLRWRRLCCTEGAAVCRQGAAQAGRRGGGFIHDSSVVDKKMPQHIHTCTTPLAQWKILRNCTNLLLPS